MQKEMYVSYDRSLSCRQGRDKPGIWFEEIQKTIADIQIYFQFQEPFNFLSDADPFNAKPVEPYPWFTPAGAPRLAYDALNGFNFPGVVKQIDILATGWRVEEFAFGIAKDDGIIIEAIPATLDQVKKFLEAHGREIQADDWLEGTACSWSGTQATLDIRELLEIETSAPALGEQHAD